MMRTEFTVDRHTIEVYVSSSDVSNGEECIVIGLPNELLYVIFDNNTQEWFIYFHHDNNLDGIPLYRELYSTLEISKLQLFVKRLWNFELPTEMLYVIFNKCVYVTNTVK